MSLERFLAQHLENLISSTVQNSGTGVQSIVLCFRCGLQFEDLKQLITTYFEAKYCVASLSDEDLLVDRPEKRSIIIELISNDTVFEIRMTKISFTKEVT